MAAESPGLQGASGWWESMGGMGEGERKDGIFAIPKQPWEEGTPGGGRGTHWFSGLSPREGETEAEVRAKEK